MCILQAFSFSSRRAKDGRLAKGDNNFLPFTFAAMDYFDPITMKRGSNEIKKKIWCDLFLRLTTRVVHLEISNSLDTDSCINAIQRFMSRRGQVKQIRSGNRTNRTLADRELRNAIKEWNQSHKLQTAH